MQEIDVGLIPELWRFPGGGHGNPFHYSCLENPHGQRSLGDYSPWGHTELDKTERLNTTVFNYAYMLSHFNPIPLCDPVDHNPPGSVQVIILARILEWVAMPSSFPSMCVCLYMLLNIHIHMYLHTERVVNLLIYFHSVQFDVWITPSPVHSVFLYNLN